MSDAPEVRNSSFNFTRTESPSQLANGQPCISQPLESKPQPGGISETQQSGSTGSVESECPLPNVIKGAIYPQSQMETRKSSPMMSTSASTPTRTNNLPQSISGQKIYEDRLSPSNMQFNAPLSTKSTAKGMNSNPEHIGRLERKNYAPSSNGPPISSLDLNYKPTSQPSSAPSVEPQPPNASSGAPYPKSIPVCSYHATSNPNSNISKPIYSLSDSQSNLSPLHSSSGSQTQSSSIPSQPHSSASPFSSHPVSDQQFPSYVSPQPGPFPPMQSSGSFPPVSSPITSPPSAPNSLTYNSFPSPPSGQMSQLPATGQMTRLPAPNQMPQLPPSGQMSQLPPAGQMARLPSPNQMPQLPPSGQISQRSPPNQMPRLSPSSHMTHIPSPGQMPHLPPTNQISQLPLPGQISTHPSSQHFNQHTSQPQPLLPSSSVMSGPPGPFGAPPSSYPVPPHPSQSISQPPLQANHQHPGAPQHASPSGPFPPQNHVPRQQPPMPHHPSQVPTLGSFRPPNHMPHQQPPMPPYIPCSLPPPVTNQPSGWAQANGIPNRLPQQDASTHQSTPAGVPMYAQGPQEMSHGMQPPPMVGSVPQQMINDPSQLSRRYPQHQAAYQQYPSGTSVGNTNSVERVSSQFRSLSVTRDGFNKLWGADCYDLLQTRNILPAERVEAPKIQLHQEYLDNVNCRPEIFRCTLTKIPETNSLLQKSRLPLGILIHPFKDINNLPVVQCTTIVRCRTCRTYINPFVYFVDHRRWKCNLCFRVNDMPEEFQFDPVTKTYGDPSRRPEIRSSTIEYIAPSEYMLRPPQAAVYLFLLDVSCGAVELGYLNSVCDVLSEELSQLPGDSRTQIGFIAFDSALHFFALAEGLLQPQHLVVSDTNEVFLPRPDNLLVNLQECKDLVQDLLAQLPSTFLNSHDTGSALGPALQAAYKLMAPTGGRVTVFQTCLPSVGPGALKVRGGDGGAKEAPAQHLNPATDFYKRLALDCSGQQVAVDLFVLGSHYTDLATLSGVSQFSGGCIHHLPRFDGRNSFEASMLDRCFHRYLSRKIGFEAVMRIRCSRGLSIHTFHGHFFVRSTDLLSLPNVNPDAGYGMQVAIDESLTDLQNICFQAALLYTSSKGERRIRVHTLCLPIAANVNDVVCAADQQCIVGLLAKMAVDRSHQSSPGDARDAFINVATDVLSTYRLTQSVGPSSGLLAPHSLRLLPLYILALLKHVAFRSGQGTRLDDRVYAMCQMKSLPLSFLMQEIYPDLYPVHNLNEQTSFKNSEGLTVPNPPRLHLSAEKLDSRGVFLLDKGETILLYVGRSVAPQFCQDVFGVPHFASIQDDLFELPLLGTQASELLHNFICYLQSEKPYKATTQVIREESRHRMHFIERLVEDRSESALSYYEFLQHLKAQIK